jgi:hypothetical protein
VPRTELACGRVGDDGDVTAAQPVRPALRLLLGWAACMAASCCTRMTWGIIPPNALVVELALCFRAHVPAGAGLLVRGGDLSCEVETCRADPSSEELVGDVANWSKSGRLASVGLD